MIEILEGKDFTGMQDDSLKGVVRFDEGEDPTGVLERLKLELQIRQG